MKRPASWAIGVVVVTAGQVCAQAPEADSALALGMPATYDGPISAIVLAPLHAAPFTCVEHAATDPPELLGDALGMDCLVLGDAAEDGSYHLPSLYRGDGRRNEDYFGWDEPVLAPMDGVVEELTANDEINRPGHMGTGRPGTIVFRRGDGVRVAYGHVRDIRVQVGDTVLAGAPVGLVGNNGQSWMPHIHIGAWRGRTPLQIRWDQWALSGL